MSSHHLMVTVTLLALAGSALAPTTAIAGSLLSGYGGPGQGNQAILGSALLNGPSGGSGAGGRGSGGGSPVGGAGSKGAARTHPGGAPAGTPPGAHASGSYGGRKHASGSSGNASGGDFRPYTKTSDLTASRESGGGSQTLGLSGADLLYILLALGVLVLTGVLTGRLARQPVWGRDAS